jgi:hypothetical protein
MTTHVREPGTYRTATGELIHYRLDREGALVVELEGSSRASLAGKPGGIELVKLSDDPDWPDVERRGGDLELFAD